MKLLTLILAALLLIPSAALATDPLPLIGLCIEAPDSKELDPFLKFMEEKLVSIGRKQGIQIIPQINLLGHQSWHSTMRKMLAEYPRFDENPSVKLPGEYKWPNEQHPPKIH